MVTRNVYQGTDEVYSTSAKFPDYAFIWKWFKHGYVPKIKIPMNSNLENLPKVNFNLHQGDLQRFFKEDSS